EGVVDRAFGETIVNLAGDEEREIRKRVGQLPGAHKVKRNDRRPRHFKERIETVFEFSTRKRASFPSRPSRMPMTNASAMPQPKWPVANSIVTAKARMIHAIVN